jgi:Large extracellular alpha-helical protein
MMLAAIDLTEEFRQLVPLVIALFQPFLVFVLIVGLVLATAHLLTMIGTRWGDRRVSSKAMAFSVFVHLLMVTGLVTMIPEYRANIFAQLAEFDSMPIRVSSILDADSAEESHEKGATGTSRLFQGIPNPDSTFRSEWERTEIPQQRTLEEMPMERPMESVPLETPEVPDRPLLPQAVADVPEQKQVPPTQMELKQADVDLPAATLPVEKRPESTAPFTTPERSSLPMVERPVEPAPANRPDSNVADIASSMLVEDRTRPDLLDTPTPDAELARSENVPVERKMAPDAAPQTPTVLDRTQRMFDRPMVPDSPAARTQPRTPVPTPDLADIERPRSRPGLPPADLPVMPLQRLPTEDAGIASLNMPTEIPQLTRSSDPFARPTGREQVPSVYKLRMEEERERALLRFGGSQESEAAVDRSLRWMASVQDPAGYWNATDYDENGPVLVTSSGVPGRQADVGVTALAVLAFLGKLNTVDQGQYSPQVNKALRWIVDGQTTKHWGEGWGSTPGYLGRNATDYEAMYCHAMATFALGEAYAMSRESPQAQWLREPLELAVNFILDVQNVDGGWRYIKGQREGDMSIFGWQVMALKSAQAAGIYVDPERIERMKKFLLVRQLGNYGGLAGYRSKEAASAALTAEVLFCRQMLGLDHNSQESREAVQIMLANMPRRSTLNFYYWYYGTLAMHQRGGPEWETWNSTVRDLLISEQRTTGPLAGSWDPRDIWGGYGGRMYSTAIATLSLEVYYRYLPLYRLQEE